MPPSSGAAASVGAGFVVDEACPGSTASGAGRDVALPGRLWAVIGLLGIVGSVALAWSAYWAVQVAPLLGYRGGVGALGTFMLVMLSVPLVFGAGCMYLARRLYARDQLARVLAIVLCSSAGLAFLLTGARDAALVVAGLVCLAVALDLLFDPMVRAAFASSAPEPATVVAARVVVVIVAAGMLLTGVMLLTLAQFGSRLIVGGALEVAFSGLLFWLSRRLKQGDATARVLVSVLAAAYVLLALVVGYGQPGVVLPVALALCTIVLLWLPAPSRAYFESLQRPSSPAVAAAEKLIESGVRFVYEVANQQSEQLHPGPVKTAPQPEQGPPGHEGASKDISPGRKATMATRGTPSDRNSVGKANMALYVVGGLAFAAGIYLATMTRTYVLTGKTTSPYLGVGIVLAVLGLALSVCAQFAAKKNLRK
jgi:hypothetical protein